MNSRFQVLSTVEAARQLSLAGARLAAMGDAAREQAFAHGAFMVNHLAPYEDCRTDLIRVREMIARLTTEMIVGRMSQANRFALAEQIEELERQEASIDQRTIYEEALPNTVTTVGKNLALDTFLAGSGYTVTGPFMGLISSTSYSATAAADTMSSHAGWLEAGSTNAPTYTSPRKTAAWSAASSGSKSLSAALSFAMTGSGTVQGCFLVYGSGAVSTIDNTSGTLYSAGAFGAAQPVINGNTLNVSYTGGL